jgi:rubrerythrin
MSYVRTTKERVSTITQEHSDQDIIRSALIAELDAASLYVAHIDNLKDTNAKEVIAHILEEEKEHIAELMCLLESVDSEQADKFGHLPSDSCIIE